MKAHRLSNEALADLLIMARALNTAKEMLKREFDGRSDKDKVDIAAYVAKRCEATWNWLSGTQRKELIQAINEKLVELSKNIKS